jgi:5-oxoprolinase (ATP-hydrolysing) subunit A
MTKPVREYRAKDRYAVDLNVDGGEGLDDEPLMEYVASVNIACGGHAGDAASMRKAARIALRRYVAINAHPSFEDVANFGRAPQDVSPEALERALVLQISTLRNIVRQDEGELVGVKPHGALYHEAARNPEIAGAVSRAAYAVSPELVLVTSPGSKLIAAGAELEMRVAVEGFADRRYRPDGNLVPREERGALVTDPTAAAAQALSIVREKRVRTTDGSFHELTVDTLCLHGDTPGAAKIGRAVRKALLDAEVVIRPLRGWRPAA